MLPLLDDAAILHNKDDIRLADGGKPVGDDEARAPLHHARKGLLNFQFRARVDGGGCLIKNQHRRQAEHHARNAEKLLLPL